MDRIVDRFLKPADPEAAAEFKYWLATFETFLQTVEAGQTASNYGVKVNK